MTEHEQLVEKLLAKPAVRAEYDKLAPEFALLEQMLGARQAAGLSRAELAERMGTKAPIITRLEASLGSQTRSPSLAMLRKYADAVGCELQVRFVPRG